MDRKDLKALAELFAIFCDKTTVEYSELLTHFQINKSQLDAYLSHLQEMGLDLSISSTKVQINHSIEAIDCDYLKRHITTCKSLNYYFTTKSTNQLAKKSTQNTIYLAEHQSEGHGRQEKQWLSPLGQSISLSIYQQFNCGLNHLSGLNIAIGVAIINASKKLGCSNLGLKWPNDVVTKQGKVAGILIEATGNSTHCQVSIGIGINWNLRQNLLDSINQSCTNIILPQQSKTEFIAKLINEIDVITKEFSDNKLKNILPIWHQHDKYLNKIITISDNDCSYNAQYLEVNKDGMLKVKTPNQTKTLVNGEVSIKALRDL